MREDGVSSVVSAVLLFSLLSASFLLWSVTTLPEWVADREYGHLEDVRDGLLDLRSDVERQAAQGDPAPVSTTLPLSAPRVPVLQPRGTQAELALEGTVRFQGTFTDPGIHVLDGAVYGDPSAPADGTGPRDVYTLELLQVRFSSDAVSGNQDHATLTVTATDGTDTATASLRHVGKNEGTADCGREVHVTVTGPGVSRTRVLTCGVGTAVSGLVVDLMRSEYGFPSALGALEAGSDITVSTSASSGVTVTGTYSALWRDSQGQTRAAGDGSPVSYTIDESGPALVFRPNHQRLTGQDLAWSAGGLVVDQAEGEAVTGPPPFGLWVDPANGTGFLRWTVTTLSGQGALQGSGLAQVAVAQQGSTRAVLTCTGATFTLTGDHGAAWRSFLRDQVQASGAVDASWDGTDDTATLTLGTGTVDQWVLDLRIIEASVTLR